MTMGQRIAQKRKELGLSQEALGEALGVSRQAIYKWESDAAMPEIEKLVALSRLFSVSVGWLLGVEETEALGGEAAPEGELTETQLKLVEEITSRYLAAQPKPKKSPWGKWGVRILFGLCGLLVASVLTINGKVDELSQRNNDLQNAVANVNSDVNRQIGSITNRVEEVLKSQNSLTADYGTELLSADLRANTATFSAYALPKTYTEGMSVLFLVESGAGEVVQVEGTEGDNQRFSATLTCPLSDNISLSVVFVEGEQRQTQLLDTFYDLYGMSFPSVSLRDYHLTFYEVDADGSIRFQEFYASIPQGGASAPAAYTAVEEAELRNLQVGLFRNQRLVSWLDPCPVPENFQGFDNEDFYRLPDQTLKLSDSDTLCLAVVMTDEYGRSRILPDLSYEINRDDPEHVMLMPVQYNRDVSLNLEDWTF